MLEIEKAIILLDEKYPKLWSSAQMAEHLKILQFIYLFGKNTFSDNIYAFKYYSDIFAKPNCITQEALDYFDSRMNKHIAIYTSAKESLSNKPNQDLTLLSELNIKNQIEYRQLITKAQSFYVIIPKFYNNKTVTVAVNDYNWYFGDFDGNDAFNKYYGQKEDLDKKFEQVVGIQSPKNISGYKELTKTHRFDNVELFEIDNTCFEINQSTISVHKVHINNFEEIFVDQINGGIFTRREFEPDYYYYLDPVIELPFGEVYGIKEDIQATLDLIRSDKKSPLDGLNKKDQRLFVLKKALKNGWLDKFVTKVETDKTVSSVTKKTFWTELQTLDKFTGEERRLFASGRDDFFKKNANELHQIIQFRSGRPSDKASLNPH